MNDVPVIFSIITDTTDDLPYVSIIENNVVPKQIRIYAFSRYLDLYLIILGLEILIIIHKYIIHLSDVYSVYDKYEYI